MVTAEFRRQTFALVSGTNTDMLKSVVIFTIKNICKLALKKMTSVVEYLTNLEQNINTSHH